jgi:Tfp pilus assembly protein FimT
MLAVVIPLVGGLMERGRLEVAAWRLASDMRLAQQVAVTTEKQTRLEFRWEAGDYRMFLPVEKTTVKLPEGINYAMNNFPLEYGVRKLSFTPLGAPSRGGTVGFKNRRGGKLYVIITPATGRVRISPEPPKD